VTRRHRKKAQLHPLVPILGPWLAAAMEVRGVSVVPLQRQLATRGVRVARQTLSYILTEQQRTCRADVRRELARVFGVTEGFLAGQPQGAGAWARTLEAQPWSPAVALAVMEFTARAEAAWRREVVAADSALADAPVTLNPRSPWAQPLRRDADLAFALADLVNGDVWRRRFLVSAPALTPAEREQATRHLIGSFAVLLQPWFTARATLNRDALREWWSQVTRDRVQPARPTPTPSPKKKRRNV